jgi:uncharacterized protein (DUF488 family)
MKSRRSGYTRNVQLLTFGHGTLAQEEIARLVQSAGIERLVDVRTVPKSRMHPWVWSDQMALWVPEQAKAEYVWARDLGGFRTPQSSSHNTALRNASFRAYADYMETERFRTALDSLVNSLGKRRTAIMCSETLWWRCHRRLISDAAVLLHGIEVTHVMANGRTQKHVLTQGVRRDDGALRYDGGAAA